MAKRQAIYNLKVDTGSSDGNLENLKKEFMSVDDAMEQTQQTGKNLKKSLSDLDNSVENVGFAFEDTTRVIDAYKNIAAEAGAESAIGQDAIQKAAKLEREYQDLEETISVMSERGNAFQSAIGISESVLGGYTAFQGVTAMVGTENEELMETLTKLQGAQSVLMGVETIRNNLQRKSATMIGLMNAKRKIATAGTWMYAAAQKGLNFAIGSGTKATKIFRGALLATGIGAIVALVGALASNFDSLSGWISDTVDWFKSLYEESELLQAILYPIVATIEGIIAALQWLGIIESEAEAAQRERHEQRIKQLDEEADRLKDVRDQVSSRYDHEIKMAKIAGEETINLERKKLKEIKDSIREEMLARMKALASRAALEEEITDQQLDQIENLKKEYIGAQRDIEVFDAETQKSITENQQEEYKKRQKAKESAEEKKRQEEEEAAKLAMERQELINDLMIQNIEDQSLRELAELETKHRREREKLIEKYGEDTALLKELELKQDGELNKLREEQKTKQEEKEAEQKEAERNERLLELENDLAFMELDFQAKLEKERELEIARRNALLAQEDLTEQERRKIRKESAAKIVEINQKENEAVKASKQSLVTAFSDVYQSLKGLVDENSELGKAMALTEIAVNTAIGFSKGLVIAQNSAAGTGPGAAFAFPIFYAQQVSAVIGAASQAKKILSSSPGISGGGGSSISAPSTGGSGGASPNINDRTENEGQLTSDSSDIENEAPSKVFVSEIDISRTQNRAEDIAVRSTI